MESTDFSTSDRLQKICDLIADEIKDSEIEIKENEEILRILRRRTGSRRHQNSNLKAAMTMIFNESERSSNLRAQFAAFKSAIAPLVQTGMFVVNIFHKSH